MFVWKEIYKEKTFTTVYDRTKNMHTLKGSINYDSNAQVKIQYSIKKLRKY